MQNGTVCKTQVFGLILSDLLWKTLNTKWGLLKTVLKHPKGKLLRNVDLVLGIELSILYVTHHFISLSIANFKSLYQSVIPSESYSQWTPVMLTGDNFIRCVGFTLAMFVNPCPEYLADK